MRGGEHVRGSPGGASRHLVSRTVETCMHGRDDWPSRLPPGRGGPIGYTPVTVWCRLGAWRGVLLGRGQAGIPGGAPGNVDLHTAAAPTSNRDCALPMSLRPAGVFGRGGICTQALATRWPCPMHARLQSVLSACGGGTPTLAPTRREGGGASYLACWHGTGHNRD